MRITLDTEKHTVEVHGTANYEELTLFVDALVEHLKWPADQVQVVERQPLATSKPTLPNIYPPYMVPVTTIDAGTATTSIDYSVSYGGPTDCFAVSGPTA